MADELHPRRIDVLAIGLFGLAVGALTLGAAQLGVIPNEIISAPSLSPSPSAASCKSWLA